MESYRVKLSGRENSVDLVPVNAEEYLPVTGSVECLPCVRLVGSQSSSREWELNLVSRKVGLGILGLSLATLTPHAAWAGGKLPCADASSSATYLPVGVVQVEQTQSAVGDVQLPGGFVCVSADALRGEDGEPLLLSGFHNNTDHQNLHIESQHQNQAWTNATDPSNQHMNTPWSNHSNIGDGNYQQQHVNLVHGDFVF